ncbi:MAG: hypothetical protein KKE05_04770 [Nanoarchaeota archaeon]|nr:hypothetical protein [Nanoarchaeota archaeon]
MRRERDGLVMGWEVWGWEMIKSKRKLLVFASTFPRWKKDTVPPFVYELSKRLTKDFDVCRLV